MARPWAVTAVFLVLAAAGFAVTPYIIISTNLMAGVGTKNPIIKLTKENNEMFGEQDSLIVVLEFPEPPGEDRLPLIRGLGEAIAEVPGVRRVRYRFLDPENLEEVTRLFKHFLLGMNPREQEQIGRVLSPAGLDGAFRRARNRLFLTENPYVQTRILEDPLELGHFVAGSMQERVGSISFGDLYLLMASPDSTVFLIQVTPSFPSTDLVQGRILVDRLRAMVPEKVASLIQSLPGLKDKSRDLTLSVTGKTAFHHESEVVFDKESSTILLCSVGLVSILLLLVYRSALSALVLMIPLAAGIGPNYGVIYLSYDEVNPVVVGGVGVLIGLGTEYGVHLWSRFRDEMDRGASLVEAVTTVYSHTGPAVTLGALTTILAFLCLCLSDQPAMTQFGYVGASGLLLTYLSTMFLFPALACLLDGRRKDRFPRIRVSFKTFSDLYRHRPGMIVGLTAALVLVSLFLATKVSYEKNLFKVFLASNMESMTVSERISQKFGANFSRPTLLSFDVDDFQEGLIIQRQLDAILEELIRKDHQIASVDSVSYLIAPAQVQESNVKVLSELLKSWPALGTAFEDKVRHYDLSGSAREIMRRSFQWVEKIMKELAASDFKEHDPQVDLERSWYTANIHGKHRFLTQIRYSHSITDMDELKQADVGLLQAVKDLPAKISISGTRQAMEQILSSLVSELFKLGLYAYVSVALLFLVVFRHPLGVGLCLIPMTGAFVLTLGVMGLLRMGLPFSIVGVAPLIFGLGIDNGIHVVMGSLQKDGSVAQAMARVTRPAILTTLTVSMGFVAVITSRHYSLEFLGWAMVIGMGFTIMLTLTTLPALLFLLEERRKTQKSA